MPIEIAGSKNKYMDKSKFSQRIEFDVLNRKSLFFDNMGIIKTNTEDINRANERVFLFPALSAIIPPIQLPIDKPNNVIPITEVQVKTELPIIGAIILDEISSTVIIEKPAMNEANI